MIRLHLTPGLGSIKLEKLSPPDVQVFLNEKLKSGLSATTVKYLRAILRKALNQALRWELIQRNVATLVEVPGGGRRASGGNPFSPAELSKLLKAARHERLGTLYLTGLLTGLRQGELLGLRWKDVDLAAKRITVDSALQFIDGEFVFAEPKTDKSRRTIELPDSLVRELKAHRKRQLRDRLLAGGDWEEWNLVFSTRTGRPLDGINVTRDFKRMQKRAEISPLRRFHDLRHTAATLLMSGNIHPRIVSELLGHSEIRTTLDLYSHVTAPMQREAAEQLDAVYRAARTRK